MKIIELEDLEYFVGVKIDAFRPLISIRPNPVGKMIAFLSRGFMNAAKEQLMEMTHVVIHYSRKSGTLVLKFTNDNKERGAIKLSTSPGNRNFPMNLFFIANPLLEKTPRKYLAELCTISGSDLGECWAINLNDNLLGEL